MTNYTKASPIILFLLFSLSQSTESAYTTGLPKLARDLDINYSLAQTSSSIYFYGFATGILVLGRLSDYVGRKTVIIGGLFLFLITCILSFKVSNIYTLIFIRFLQAFGASVGSGVAQAVARDGYVGRGLSKLYVTLSSGLAIMPSISSFIGSHITSILGWRYIFIYLFSVVFMTMVLCILWLPETNNFTGRKQKFSFLEVLQAMSKDIKVLCFGVMIGIFNGIMYSLYIEAPHIFIDKLGISTANYGYITLTLGIAAAFGGLYNRSMQASGIEDQILIKRGIITSNISCLGMIALAILWHYGILKDFIILPLILLPIIFQSFSFGVTMPLVLRLSLEDYTRVNGTAGAIFGAFYYIIVATSSFITTRLHDNEHIIKTSIFFTLISLLSFLCYKFAKRHETNHKPFAI